MGPRKTQSLALIFGALLYWLIVSLASDVREPWDAPSYWTIAYPLALALSATLGFLTRLSPWLIGAVLILAQLPVMLSRAEMGAMIAMGVVYLCLLALPATVVAWAGRRLRQRRLR